MCTFKVSSTYAWYPRSQMGAPNVINLQLKFCPPPPWFISVYALEFSGTVVQPKFYTQVYVP